MLLDLCYLLDTFTTECAGGVSSTILTPKKNNTRIILFITIYTHQTMEYNALYSIVPYFAVVIDGI